MSPVALSAGFVVLFVAGLLRAGGASLVRTPRADALHDAAEGIPGARRVAAMLDDREVIVPAVNIVHSILLTAAIVPSAWALTTMFRGPLLAVVLVFAAMIAIVVGDLLPRTVGRARPRRVAYRMAPLLGVAIAVGSRAADIMWDEDDEEEEADDGENVTEVSLITSVLEFSDTIVREVMVPRPDMVVIEQAATLTDLLRTIDEHGFSRIPAIGEGIDDVVGVVIVKDLLPRLANGYGLTTVADVMRPIDFVPETKRVPDLLREMQASKSHMAVVVDEYGGTAGLVTIEDLLEELVGEIVDEYDDEELLVEEQDDGSWKVDGRMPVSELSDIVHSELPDEEWDTVGGLVLGLAGRVPHEGERFEAEAVVLTVTRVQGRRVAEVVVERAHVHEPESEVR